LSIIFSESRFPLGKGVVTEAILGLVAAVTAALITRSVMISNHRQAWINGLRDDLASFFTAVDVIHFKLAALSQGGDLTKLEEQQKARNDVLLAYRRILMRLNMNEPLHQKLENALESLLTARNKTVDQTELAAAVTLARTVLKQEWEVTKYGPFTTWMTKLKGRWRKMKTWWENWKTTGK
jgi:hypothetical protein